MSPAPAAHTARLAEVALTFLRLGCTSFGGPVAHLGYLRAELVERRRWTDDAHFADLVALCQTLPGPASSQVVFALGMLRAGALGALVASLCFTLPSALSMLAFAYGVGRAGDLRSAGWLRGLEVAAVAVVAQAVWAMGKKLCPDRARASLCLASAAGVLALPGPLAQPCAIAAGALVGWRLYRGSAPAPDPTPTPTPASPGARWPALGALALFAVLLALLPVLASHTRARLVVEFDAFYRAGALVFGGGHVVLPLLRAELVPRGWITDDRFLAGYGAAQALPGPLFALAAYLGASIAQGPARWARGLWTMFAVFLPGWLLVAGALPFWRALRAKRWAQGALAGANAAVVGVLLAALYSPVVTTGVHSARDAAGALLAFALLEHAKAPPWLVVLGAAALGEAGSRA